MKLALVNTATDTIENVVKVDPQNLPTAPDGFRYEERAGDIGDVLVNGEWVTPPPDPKALAAQARDKRNALLTASDWTQVADAPVDQTAWATYRQALRDITDQAGFPEAINWPVAPE